MTSHLRRSVMLAAILVIVGALALVVLRRGPAPRTKEPGPPLTGEATVWIVDDGHRISSGDGAHPAMQGNALWRPGEPLSLFGLRGETLAFQVVVSAGDEPLEDVTVDLDGLWNLPVERFVTYELPMPRRSGGEDPRESLGWSAGTQPPGPAPGSALVDPLVPVERADHAAARGERPWDYPMTVPKGRHRVVWIDLFIPDHAPVRPLGGRVTVRAGERLLEAIPVELDVAAATLPFAAAKTMLFSSPATIVERVGDGALVPTLQLLHRHHITPVLPLDEAAALDEEPMRGLLTGELFTRAHGYQGPGEGVGADIAVLGIYGTLGMPGEERLEEVGKIVARLDELAPEADRFLYAVDEQCESERGPAWRRALARAQDERLRDLEVGHTCSIPPADQEVDLVMMFAPEYRPALAAAAEPDQRVWIYNGALPRTGCFLSDGWPIGLRANPWIQHHFDIERWFYWESVFWNDDNRGGLGPYDPWATAETFHNADGDHCNGDGVLLYPGHQTEPGYLDLGLEATLPSYRLKQWRRGIQDVGYLELVAEREPERAEAIASELVGRAFEAEESPRFPTDPAAWLSARRKLFDILKGRP